MARITIEDCLEKIPNRFDLALSATYRARQLAQARFQKLKPKINQLSQHYEKLQVVM